MKILILTALLASCASHQERQLNGPSWVNAVRSGEEQLKVKNGNKTFYRRIAGGPHVSRQTSCELVIHKAEEDIRKEYPTLHKIPYTVEVIYYDEDLKDCAVTLSVSEIPSDKFETNNAFAGHERLKELKSKDTASDVEVAEIIGLRADIAARYALTGLTLNEFEKYTKEKVSVLNGEGLCSKTFSSQDFSIHGTIEICWKNNYIRGYCTPKSQQCWIRSP